MRTIFPYQEDIDFIYIEVEGIDRLDKILEEYSDYKDIRKINKYNGNLNGSYIKLDKEIVKLLEEDYNG